MYRNIAEYIKNCFLFHQKAKNEAAKCKRKELNNFCWNFKAAEYDVVTLEGPMHNKLDLWVSFEHRELIFVDIGFAFMQWTRHLLSTLVENVVTSRLTVNAKKWEWKLSYHSLDVRR